MPEKKQMIIQKEDAVFWMDENGIWQNEHGRFEHPKVIRYFNSSIHKDSNGYYVHQETDEFVEKVYFTYKETAVFVVDLKIKPDVRLVLNTMKTAGFNDGKLFTQNDSLYLQTSEHLIKFSSQALIKLSKYLKDCEGQMQIEIEDEIYPVASKE